MFDETDFDALFRSIRNQKVLIIGDVMIDSYLWGKVRRVSPEAPVPIVSGIMEENRLGGAANVALNIKSMGAVPILCSVIGRDERGSVFLELLEEQNLTDVGIQVDETRVTTQKTRVISGYQHLLRVDEEMENELSTRMQEHFIEIILNLMETGGIDSIIFQDYDKGVITPNIISRVVRLARELRIPVLVDPKFRNFNRYMDVTLFKPNFKELINGVETDLEKGDFEKIAEVAEQFRRKQNHQIVMVTLSDKGILVAEEGTHHHLPAQVRDITDVSGAGDTVVALSALCYSAGLTPPQIASVANLAGGQVCERSGVVPVEHNLLLEECKKLFTDSPQGIA